MVPALTTLPCTPVGIGEEHEGLALLGGRRRIGHGLGRAVVVVDLDEIARRDLQLGHVIRVHLDEGIGPPVHDELVVLVEIGVLPDVVGAPVVDQVLELLLLLLLAGRLQPAPLRFHEGGLAVLAAEFAVGEETFGADDLAVLEVDGGLLEAVGAHGAQSLVGDELPALLVLGVAVHEGVFFGLPIEALELVGILGIAESRSTRSMLLAMRAAIRQSGIDSPGGSM